MPADTRLPGERTNVRTIVLVTVLSLLVWLLAESRTVRTETVILTPTLESGTGSGVLTRAALGTDWPDNVRVSLTGSAAGLDQVIRALRGRMVMRVGIEVPAAPGTHDIDLREMLRSSEVFRSSGASVEEVDPARVSIEVDAVAEASVPVRVIAPEGVAFEPNAAPKPNPPAIRVIGPAKVVARLAGAEAVVRLVAGDLAALTPGRASTLTGQRYELPQDPDRWATRIEPAQIDVTMTLRSRTADVTLPAMPVQIMLAPGEIGRWQITPEPGFQDLVGVVVSGPSDQVDRLRSGELVTTAYIALSFDELERGVDSKPAQIAGLPPGVRIAPGQDLTIRLRVTKRTEPVSAETP